MNRSNQFFITFILLFVLKINLIGQDSPKKLVLIKYSTVEEMNSMAREYNYPYIISETKNNGVLFMTKEQARTFFRREVKVLDEFKQIKEFNEQTVTVHNYGDYFNLIEKFPYIKQRTIREFGTQQEYDKYKFEVRKTKWAIFRKNNGELSFYPTSTLKLLKNSKNLGERIDNLPRE